MNSPIAFRQFDEAEYRDRVRSLTDEELISEGETMRRLSGDGKIVSTTTSVFDQKLMICREEYRRRYPKSLSPEES